MMKILKRYSFFIIALIGTVSILIYNNKVGIKAFDIAGSSFMQMLQVLPPIMLMLGLMDVWIPREKMIKYMGENSGILGIAIAIVIGSVGAGPMYAAFPFTAILIKKGAKFSNVIIFMNAWCVTKVSTVLFEISYLGYKFTLLRLIINLPVIIIMGIMVQHLMGRDELIKIYNTD